MALTYLLDTNVLSEIEKPRPNQKVLKQITRHHTEICTSALNWYELLHGYHRHPNAARKKRIESYLLVRIADTIPILSFNESAADWLAQATATLQAEGRTPPIVDSQIAAIAYVNNLTVVTRNITDFSIFPGLKSENWFE